MKPFVFLSHSSHDATLVKAVCHQLEERGIRCWMAPRDVLPGAEWSAQITGAIRDAAAFLLVLSTRSNDSKQVLNEVGLASRNAVPILPFRIEDVKPNDALDYFMSAHHWLDAVTPPLQDHVERLGDALETLIRLKTGAPLEETDPDRNLPGTADSGRPSLPNEAPESPRGERTPPRPSRPAGKLPWILAAAACLALVLVAGKVLVSPPAEGAGKTEASAGSGSAASRDPRAGETPETSPWDPEAPRRALVIGVAKYAEAPTLLNPVNDALLVRRTLETCGFKVDFANDVTLDELESALAAFCGSLDWRDHTVFFFSGQGCQLNGKEYLMPADTRIANSAALVQSSLPVERIVKSLTDATAGLKLVVLDSCRDEVTDAHRGVSIIRKGTRENLVVCYSTSPGAVAVDGSDGNSPFTAALSRSLLQPGRDLMEALRQTTSETSAATGGAQVPEFSGSLLHPFVFVPR